jgi:hypothetical protein
MNLKPISEVKALKVTEFTNEEIKRKLSRNTTA